MCVGRRKLLYASFGFVPVENNWNPFRCFIGATPNTHTGCLISSHTIQNMG